MFPKKKKSKSVVLTATTEISTFAEGAENKKIKNAKVIVYDNITSMMRSFAINLESGSYYIQAEGERGTNLKRDSFSADERLRAKD